MIIGKFEICYKTEKKYGLAALWWSTLIPVTYLVKDLIVRFDIKRWLDANGYSSTTKVYFAKFEPVLQGSYVDVAAALQLCVSILALVAVYWPLLQRAVLLLPYVICTCCLCVSIAAYLLFFIIWRKPYPTDEIMVLSCIVIYTLILVHAYCVRLVLRLWLVLNEIRRTSKKSNVNEGDLVDIPLPMPYIELTDKNGKSCPSMVFSDLLYKYEPYFPEVNEQDQYKRSHF